MRFNSEIFLLAMNDTENAMGDTIEVPVERKVFAEKISVRQTEFYQAAANGFKPQKAFKIWVSEYNDETQLMFEGITYSIIRTYSKDDKELELICEGAVNNGAS
ncbi:phage head closure protein [Sporosarcina sp. OR05]|uniref:phage head closure protein n=1 Tax=Sporosarcina sp. OR05 TaxID=2969819 RepID=UPI00352B2519